MQNRKRERARLFKNFNYKRFKINRTFVQGLPIKLGTPTKLESRRRGFESRVYVSLITRTSRLPGYRRNHVSGTANRRVRRFASVSSEIFASLPGFHTLSLVRKYRLYVRWKEVCSSLRLRFHGEGARWTLLK